MFHSARIRLTFFYLAVIMAISLLFSLAIYSLSSRSISGSLRRQATYFENLPRYDFDPNFNLSPDSQAAAARHELQFDLLLVNLAILVIAGYGSYLMADKTLEPLEEALDAQSRFTADASHELRTPLTAMKTEIEVALRSSKLPIAEARDLLVSNLEEISKLEALANGLLKLASQDKEVSYDSDVSLDRVAAEAVSRLKKVVSARHQEIESTLSEVSVRGDYASLVELAVILLDNASKYSEEKSPISLSVSSSNNHAKLRVSDQGKGIAETDIEHIFDRFYRSDTSRSKNKADGYGLGLSIAKKIAENHGGIIRVSSAIGHGSSFTLELPLSR
ncbi:MAG: sensor histidine kinase [Candidatus Saccharimonadia bacterium]